MSKMKLKLEKESLMNLQEDQMKTLIGADGMSNDSGAVCDAKLEIPLGLQNESCCRRSCQK